MKNIDLDALDFVSGGMDIKSLHSRLGGGDSAHMNGPGFAPLGHEPGGLTGGLPTSGSPGVPFDVSHASPGLDPLNSAPMQAPVQAPEQDHSFSNDLQAISSIVNAFAGIIGAFNGGSHASSPSAPSSPQGRAVTREPSDQNDQSDPTADQGPSAALGNDQGADAAPTGGVAENDGTGNHTNFHETNDGFVRG